MQTGLHTASMILEVGKNTIEVTPLLHLTLMVRSYPAILLLPRLVARR